MEISGKPKNDNNLDHPLRFHYTTHNIDGSLKEERAFMTIKNGISISQSSEEIDRIMKITTCKNLSHGNYKELQEMIEVKRKSFTEVG